MNVSVMDHEMNSRNQVLGNKNIRGVIIDENGTLDPAVYVHARCIISKDSYKEKNLYSFYTEA